MGKLIDLTGKKFGKLTVEYRFGKKWNWAAWMCLCDCGNKIVVAGVDLTRAHVKSCGCSKFVDITGKRFGRLVATKIVGRDKAGHLRWECKCDCGNKITALSTNLLTGDIISCKCKQRENRYLLSNIAKSKKFIITRDDEICARRRYNRRYMNKLTDNYVIKQLVDANGADKNNISAEQIATKRLQLLTYRSIKQAKERMMNGHME